MNTKAILTMVIAMVAMIGLTGLGSALPADVTTTYRGDGTYDLTYSASGGGDFSAQTYTSVGYDLLNIDYDADMSGSQQMSASGGWTQVHIDRDAQTNNGDGLITTASVDNTGLVDNVVTTSVSSDNFAKVIGQDVDITMAGVGVVTYQAAADDGAMRADTIGGSMISGTYKTGVLLNAEDHSVLYTDASAGWGVTRVDFDTDVDSRELPYGGTDGAGQLVVYTNTDAKFGMELDGTYDSTTFSVDINDGYDGYTETVIDFDSNCDVNGYGATAYWYTVNN